MAAFDAVEMIVDQFNYLNRRKEAELNHAFLATCPVEKTRHEEQARAYAKIIAVLRREKEDSLRVR